MDWKFLPERGMLESKPNQEIPGRFGFGPTPEKSPVHDATPLSVNGTQAPRWSARRPRFRVRRRVAFQSSCTYPEKVGYHRLSRAERLAWAKPPTPIIRLATWLLEPQFNDGLERLVGRSGL